MSEEEFQAPRTASVVRRRWWPRFVWGIPLAALLVVAWLGLHGLAEQGAEVRLDVPSAEGITIGDTHVTYKGMTVGKVAAIALAPDPRRIRLTLRIDASMTPLLREGTQFWVTGSNANLADLSALRATISGPAIGMIPGPGRPWRQFSAVERGPVVPPGTPGTRYQLMTHDVVSIEPGTQIYTHGLQVGTILSVQSLGANGFRLEAFVKAPFDLRVDVPTRFWNASAVQLTTSAGGLEARSSPKIALSGVVEFDTPPEAADGPRAPEGASFALFSDQSQAATAPLGLEVPYQIALDGPVGDIKPGAPVKLRGFAVGRVLGVSLAFDAKSGALQAPVTIGLDTTRLHVAASRQAVDATLDRLVRQGLRARLGQAPPLIGARIVDLDFVGGAPGERLRPGSPYPWLPATVSGDTEDVIAKADEILTKVNTVPIAEIGRNLRTMTGNLAALTASPKVRDSLDHLDHALATLDKTVQQTGPKIGPLVDSLRHTADEAQATAAAAGRLLGADGGAQDGNLPSAIRQLDEAGRSIRSLADYLSRHPEAIIQGKKEKR